MRWSTSPPRTSPLRARATACPSISNVTIDYGTLTGLPPEDLRRCAVTSKASARSRSRPRCAWRVTCRRPGGHARRVRSPRPRPPRTPRHPCAAAQGVGDARDRGCVWPGCDRPRRMVRRASHRLVGTRRPHRRREPAACCVAATTPSATKAAGTSNDATTEPTKPKNRPPPTIPPGDTDAHHPRPPDPPRATRTFSSTLPTAVRAAERAVAQLG